MKTNRTFARWGTVSLLLVALAPGVCGAGAQVYDSSAPAEPVKLIFIHHSCGENWLADDHGGLGLALAQNNYYVSDTNYGWGPDSIGDRTDIINWPEWFVGADSSRYLAALYSESGQNSPYTRPLADPGGENRVILFKSCFPNSDLEGNPGDAAERDGDSLSVGNAKAIYNELLSYFASRQDKLFVAITAPPALDPTYSANARAFNNWLVEEWLSGYVGTNVAVWDFYNVLTGPDSHHRIQSGTIERVWGSSDTLYYPTDGDNHPSPAGNRKATEEFIPMLNVYFHLWEPGAAEEPPAVAPQTEVTTERAIPAPLPAAADGTIDDFEAEGAGWEVFTDGGAATRLTCERDVTQAHSGTAALVINYDIAPEGWGTCSLLQPTPEDWSGQGGIAFFVRAEHAGQPVTVAVYQGDSLDELGTFESRFDTEQSAVDGWQQVQILWHALQQPSWEGDGTASFEPDRALGLAFAFGDESGSGVIWVDDLTFMTTEGGGLVVLPALHEGAGEAAYPPPEAITQPEAEAPYPVEALPEEPYPVAGEEKETQPTQAPDSEGGGNGICPGTTAVGLMALAGMTWVRRRDSHSAAWNR